MIMTMTPYDALVCILGGAGIPQVTLEDDSDVMEPIKGFVAEMAQNYPESSVKDDFSSLLSVLTAQNGNPHEVEKAIVSLKNDASSDRFILASFKALQQGKKLMGLAEDLIQTKTHLVKVIADLDAIVSRCETHSLSMGDITIEAGMKAVTSECSSLRALASQISADDVGGGTALQKSKDAIKSLAQALLLHHLKKEASSYLRVQADTLDASRIVSKPPEFPVLNVNEVVEKTIGSRLSGFDDLKGFYAVMGNLAETTDALLRLPTGGETISSPEKLRSTSVQLCQQFQLWKEHQGKVLCSCRALDDDSCISLLHDSLEQLVSVTSVRVWEAAMELPLAALRAIVQRNHPEMDTLTKAFACIPDAKLLATGPQCSKMRSNLSLATQVAEMLIQAGIYVKGDSEVNHAKATRQFFDFLIAMSALPSDAVLNRGTAQAVDLHKLELPDGEVGGCFRGWVFSWLFYLDSKGYLGTRKDAFISESYSHTYIISQSHSHSHKLSTYHISYQIKSNSAIPHQTTT